MRMKGLLTAATFCMLSVGFNPGANALFITERADITQAPEPAGTGIVVDLLAANQGLRPTGIDTISAPDGQIYTNATNGNTFDAAGNIALGNDIRTVGAAQVGSILNSTTFSPTGYDPTATQDGCTTCVTLDIVAVFGVQGPSVAAPAGFEQDVQTGRIALVALDPGTFERRDPRTWGIGAGQQNIIAEWALKPRETVTQGLGEQVGTVPADQVNVTAINSAIGLITDGSFLFREDTAGSLVPSQLRADAPGDDFVTTVTNLFGLPGCFGSPTHPASCDEGIYATTQQEIEGFDLNARLAGDSPLVVPEMGLTGTIDAQGNEIPSVLSAAASVLAALNAVAAFAGFTDTTGIGGIAANLFASGITAPAGGAGTGPVTCAVGAFCPDFAGGLTTGINITGDFRGFLTITDAFPGIQIPEPGPMALLAFGLIGLGFAARRKTARR